MSQNRLNFLETRSVCVVIQHKDGARIIKCQKIKPQLVLLFVKVGDLTAKEPVASWIDNWPQQVSPVKAEANISYTPCVILLFRLQYTYSYSTFYLDVKTKVEKRLACLNRIILENKKYKLVASQFN